MSDEIRITDLAQPELSAAQQGALAYAETLQIELTRRSILQEARQRDRPGRFRPPGLSASDWTCCATSGAAMPG